jgi:hypothetical protein
LRCSLKPADAEAARFDRQLSADGNDARKVLQVCKAHEDHQEKQIFECFGSAEFLNLTAKKYYMAK